MDISEQKRTFDGFAALGKIMGIGAVLILAAMAVFLL